MSNLKDFLGGLDPATWTDAKAAYLDDNISTKAPASTALSTATWTAARASSLDNLDAAISTRAPASTALSSNVWTSGRASNLDNLDAPISGLGGGLDPAVWTNTKAGYLDTTISSRAPASTALSNNVWTTTYRNRIDTTISSRLSACNIQRLATRTYINSNTDYDTWTISARATNKTFITMNGSGTNEYYSTDNYVTFTTTVMGASARMVNTTNVRYVIGQTFTGQLYNSYFNGTGAYNTPALMLNNQFYWEITATYID